MQSGISIQIKYYTKYGKSLSVSVSSLFLGGIDQIGRRHCKLGNFSLRYKILFDCVRILFILAVKAVKYRN